MLATTPVKANGSVGSFCRQINKKNRPVYITPGQGKAGYCSLNALEYYIKNPLSKIVSGWIIWQGAGILEAEHHTVISDGGKLIDVTAALDGEEKILFLPDDSHYTTWRNGYFRQYGNYIKKHREEFYHMECKTRDPIGGTFDLIGQPALTDQAKNHFLSMPYDNYYLLKILD